MKIKASIARKLLIVTMIIFAVFIGSTLLVQSLFFEKFYINKKKNDMINNIDKFKADYLKIYDSNGFNDLIEEYSENAGVKIAIIDPHGNIKFMSRMTKGRFDITNSRELAGYIRKWIANSDNRSYIKQQSVTMTTMLEISKGREKVLIGVSPVNEKNEIIFCLASLQPVNEAASVIEQLYLYFSIGALFFSTILAFFYSNLVTKPLVSINKAATKMAHLDFSEKCNIGSQDEIGNVAASLNFLSENLDHALTSLRAANAKLEEDIKKERNLENMRKEFIASVSHELKTPLSLIDGYATGLKDDVFVGKERDYYLDIIVDEARKMGRLVSDMLDLSQLESGSFKLTREEFVLTDLIRFTFKKYETLIEEKPAALVVDLIENVRIYADWNRMEQVITNFITNALRHVNENGTITVRMVNKECKVSVEIENTGSSIPENEIEKIWDKFYKVDKSGSKKLSGTGIGLSIVKKILLLHEYPFGVENTENGVKFYFVLHQQNDLPASS